MMPFAYKHTTSGADASALTVLEGHKLLGGGTNLVDLMRKGVEHPTTLVDVTALSSDISDTEGGGLLIGAAVRNSAVAAHPLVRAHYPMLSRAILAGASAQIRNMATVAGNLMQRTRCAYFNDPVSSCNKRQPGSGCDALEGFNRYHAILGGSPDCIATHPSDMCVALMALDSRVHLSGTSGTRIVPLADFYLLPGERPDLETVLEAGEIITAVEIPPSRIAERSTYRKVRDRASYAFALVSVAAGISIRDGKIEDISLAFGGIAPKPWRAMLAEDALRGGPATAEAFAAAMETELADARPLAGNAFKVELLKRTTVAVLAELTGDKS